MGSRRNVTVLKSVLFDNITITEERKLEELPQEENAEMDDECQDVQKWEVMRQIPALNILCSSLQRCTHRESGGCSSSWMNAITAFSHFTPIWCSKSFHGTHYEELYFYGAIKN